MPVGLYDIYFKKGNAINKTIELSKYEKIHIVNCQYNELGFIRLNSDSIKQLDDENMYDNFL